MSCPNCGSLDVEPIKSEIDYNMGKGMIGTALGGQIGSLAGFEGVTTYICKQCSCVFRSDGKIKASGRKGTTHFDVGLKDVVVEGSQRSYKVKGIYLTITDKSTNKIEEHYEIYSLVCIEYKLNPANMIITYKCRDDKNRQKNFTDLTASSLEKLINAIKAAINAFECHELYPILSAGITPVKIIEIKPNVKTYAQKKTRMNLILAAVCTAFITLVLLISIASNSSARTGENFGLVIAVIIPAFLISYGIAAAKNK